jgi:hypothetical protein
MVIKSTPIKSNEKRPCFKRFLSQHFCLHGFGVLIQSMTQVRSEGTLPNNLLPTLPNFDPSFDPKMFFDPPKISTYE